MVYRANTAPDKGDLHTGTRQCAKCRRRQPMDEFYWSNSKLKVSRFHTCKTCGKRRGRDYKQSLSEEDLQQLFEVGKEYWLRSKYGLTPLGFKQLLENQDHKCAICKNNLSTSLHIDHCHETGEVRGILCFLCNTALGKFDDSVDRLQSAIAYLRQTPPHVETVSRTLTVEERRARRSEATRKSWERRRAAKAVDKTE